MRVARFSSASAVVQAAAPHPTCGAATRGFHSTPAATAALSRATVQFSIFGGAVRAIDACTQLPFPYHVQRLLDSALDAESKASGARVDASAARYWVDEEWAIGAGCTLAATDAAATPVPAPAPATPAAVEATTTKKGKGKTPKKGATNEAAAPAVAPAAPALTSPPTSAGVAGVRVALAPWTFSAAAPSAAGGDAAASMSGVLRHVSAYAAPVAVAEATTPATSGDATGDAPNGTAVDAPSGAAVADPVLAALRCPGGTPRCGQTGAFFSRQDFAYALAVAARRDKRRSPFWVPASHPALRRGAGDKAPFLELKPDDAAPVIATARALLFPASRLALGSDAAKSILSPAFLAAKGTAAAAGMNAVSGLVLREEPLLPAGDADAAAAVDASSPPPPLAFLREDASFACDGWVSFEQVMRLGLPLVAPTGAGGARTAAARDDVFDGGVLVEVLRRAYYNQEQLVKPGRLAMRRMPGAPEPLLEPGAAGAIA
jgi:hypothetical protein